MKALSLLFERRNIWNVPTHFLLPHNWHMNKHNGNMLEYVVVFIIQTAKVFYFILRAQYSTDQAIWKAPEYFLMYDFLWKKLICVGKILFTVMLSCVLILTEMATDKHTDSPDKIYSFFFWMIWARTVMKFFFIEIT